MVLYNVKVWFQKRRWAKKAGSSILTKLYQQKLPSRLRRVCDTRFLVVDCEMTGLNPNQDSLLSIGWVGIDGSRIELATAYQTLIYTDQPLNDSPTIHGIKDHQVAGAASVARALASLAGQAEGKVLIFHHARLDLAFLQRAALGQLGCPLYFAYLDTMQIERRRLALRNRTAPLQLQQCRERYGLAPMLQHDALADARATAELFIAQCAQMDAPQKLTLGDLGLDCSAR